jgi:hypothetical protein
LAAKQQRLVMVIDGLEDLFQNLATAQEEQTALRALVQEVPEWLEQQPERPMGLLVFVRRDMVMDAVRQNAAQLMHRYEPYALQWSRAEVLRLAAWVAKKANLLPTLPEEALQEQEEDELTEALVPLWGRKLGRPAILFAFCILRLQGRSKTPSGMTVFLSQRLCARF